MQRKALVLDKLSGKIIMSISIVLDEQTGLWTLEPVSFLPQQELLAFV